MHETPALPEPLPAVERPRHLRAFVVVFTAAVLHGWLVWGYSGMFWGEQGVWLEALERFAAGEAPYREFTFGSPPLSLWVLGGLARLIGTSYTAITAITTSLYLVIIGVFILALRRLVPDMVLAVGLPSLLFAVSFAARSGVPLPAGTDAAGTPIGFLCLMGGAWLLFEAVDRPDLRKAAGAGALLALAMLGKDDFWVAVLYLLAAGGVVLARRHASSRVQAAMPMAFGAVLIVGLGVAIAGSGWSPVIHSVLGPARAIQHALLATPSLERLVAEIAGSAALVLTAVTALWLCLAMSDRVAARWAGAMLLVFLTAAAVHMGTTVAIGADLAEKGLPALATFTEDALWRELQRGRALFPAAVGLFDSRFQAHMFPVILPPILLAVLLLRWKKWHDPLLRGRLALLLGLCIVARTHRGAGGADWYNVMIDVPTYAVFLQLLCGPHGEKAARAVRAALSVLVVLGLYTYVSNVPGLLTLEGRHPVTPTRNGGVRWSPRSAALYETADRLLGTADSTGTRPILAFGMTGGWNYFLKRRNPLPYLDGLPSAGYVHDSATARLLGTRPPPLLIDNVLALRPTIAAGSFLDWEPPTIANRFVARDRAWFEALLARCAMVADADSTALVRVFDCR